MTCSGQVMGSTTVYNAAASVSIMLGLLRTCSAQLRFGMNSVKCKQQNHASQPRFSLPWGLSPAMCQTPMILTYTTTPFMGFGCPPCGRRVLHLVSKVDTHPVHKRTPADLQPPSATYCALNQTPLGQQRLHAHVIYQLVNF
jgi:hypothetical protein